MEVACASGAAMTNRERVLAVIRQRPGLTDRQIREATGIEPHQQVNRICRRLADQGLVRRERGPNGITNHPTATTATPRPQRRRARSTPRTMVERGDRWQVGPVDWDHTLLVLPCSAAKTDAASSADTGVSLLDHLPPLLRTELAEARRRSLAGADLDDTNLVPALDRYDGWLYRQLDPVRAALRSRHVVIISGGYGLALGAEPIGRYNTQFRATAWPGALIARCLTTYVARNHLTDVVAFAAATTDYVKPVRRVAWPAGVAAWLLTPTVDGGGAMRRTPTAIGEAIAALVQYGRLDDAWRAADGTAIHASRLR
ncbi:hypothetical protein BH23ACT10_BH23ACT10_20780 [soil metagenome]